MNASIRVDGLSKQYRLGQRGAYAYGSLRETIMGLGAGAWNRLTRFRNRPGRTTGADGANTLWALKDVTFEVKPGEVVGIIGRNGAGKSTLLKILSRVVDPTEGQVEVAGRLASMLEVGTGFHPELTGRENIYLNGAILGMGRREVRAKFDDIVAFAGVERMLDTPVKFYSSGMYVRLAFAVSAHVQPDVLVIDEVLAVGDVGFQAKCLQHLDRLRRSGMTILLVSHHMPTIKRACPRAILLDKGKMLFEGDPATAIAEYQKMVSGDGVKDNGHATTVMENSPVRLAGLTWATTRGERGEIEAAKGVTFTIEYEASAVVEDPSFHLSLMSPDRRVYTGWDSGYAGFAAGRVLPGRGRIKLTVPYFGIEPGAYVVSLGIWTRDGFTAYDWCADFAQVMVTGDKRFMGSFELPAQWDR
jgi:lipopolysaccharide transport system ATP-binding protein